MPLLDPETVGDFLSEEIPAALAFAAAHDIPAEWVAETRTLSVQLNGKNNVEGQKEQYLLVGTFEDYRVVPPTWRFVDPRTREEIGVAAYPQGAFPTGSVFHGTGVVCAPWSRDAYADRGGPHGDWSDATKWQTTAPDNTQASTIADMLARIYAEMHYSPGRMAPLPSLPKAEAEAA